MDVILGERSALLDELKGVSHRFFGRTGGTSPAPWRGLNTSFVVGDAPARVEENLARCRFQIGVPRRALFTASQVHGARVLEVGAGQDPEQVKLEEADALITRAPDLAVAVRTADCAPVLLARLDGAAVGAAHAGWRGAVGGVVEATAAALGEPGELVAAVGPCIGQEAFEVGPEVREAVLAVVSDAEDRGLVRAGEGDRSHVDLAGFVVAVLENLGVSRVERVGGCTATETDRYFSHRAEAGKTGRQLSAIAICPPPVLDPSVFA
jgi:YfiH family protein